MIPVIPFDRVRQGEVTAIQTAAAAIRAACLDSGDLLIYEARKPDYQ